VQIISKKYLLKKKEIKTNVVILWFLGVRCTGGGEMRELENEKMNSDKNHFLTGQTYQTNWIG